MAMAFSVSGFVTVLCSLLFLPVALAGCGYESCNPEVPGMLNVHLIAHTHNDAGWLITVDQYYYRQVEFILDGIIRELELDPTKRFTYVEMAFFTRWWKEQNEDTKERVRNLVNDGRLEFTLGGWVMNDEAASHYTAIIDQHSLGFDFLRTTFGECGRPRIGWQIDPFGHSREQASIFAQFGFDGQFFGRLDEQDKDKRKETNTMEFVWHGSPDNLGSSSDLFTGVLPEGYGFPKDVGLDLDVHTIYKTPVTQQTIHDDRSLKDYNVEEMVANFTGKINDYRSWYNTDHVIVTMGGDFNYVDALFNFKEIDKLIKYTNAQQVNGSKINVLYSTPSCYLKALNDDDRTWTTKSDDFFPYANANHTYWTGFYTSRPAQKFYTRKMNSFLQSVKQLSGLAKLDNSKGDLDNVHKLAAAVSLGQHHDAVTGTEKQVVAFDYAQRMSEGQAAGENTVNSAYAHLMSKNGSEPPVQMFCHYMNVSVCPEIADKTTFEVTMYNPLTWAISYDARIPVNGNSYIVYDEDGEERSYANVFNAPKTSDATRPEGMNPAPYLLYFRAELPPLGYVTYFVKRADVEQAPNLVKSKGKSSESFHIDGEYVSVYFDSAGKVDAILNNQCGFGNPFTQDFYYYVPFVGDNKEPNNQSSGAYIFRPFNNTPTHVGISSYDTILGTVVSEVRQVFTDWLNQTIRVYYDKPWVEFEWTVGPIPYEDNVGKEIFTRYNSSWPTGGVFYTDANGREIIERKLNYRPTWDVDIDEPVAGNYFPVDSHFHLKDGKDILQFTVLTDRSEGATSLNDGNMELMLHRRLLNDDNYGVGEALNEPGLDGNGLIVTGKHYVMMDVQQDAAKGYRPVAKEIFMSPKLSFSNSQMEPKGYVDKFVTKWTGLAEDLPPQVHLLTLEKFKDGGPVTSPTGSVPYLVRFEHIYEVGEDEYLSQPVTFDIQHLFRDLEFVDATELTLGANIAAADVNRLKWNFKDEHPSKGNTKPSPALKDTKVTLNPMQIVTLQINYRA